MIYIRPRLSQDPAGRRRTLEGPMWRIGSPDLEPYSSPDRSGAGAVRPRGRMGRGLARLMVWSVVTVAVTMLLRPNAARGRSLFFGSGPAAEMFNKVFGLSSSPEVVQKAPGITLVARGPAHRTVGRRVTAPTSAPATRAAVADLGAAETLKETPG